MKQIVQSLRDGSIELIEVPCPAVRPGHVLIRSRLSLISAGTERMLLEFGRASWWGKARSQPDKLRQVFDKVRTDGLAATLESVKAKLDEPLPLGYANLGTVLQVGSGVSGLSVGDRVVSNGPHAEVVCVPKHLVAKVPPAVSDEAASFTVVGAIGLQGIRLAQPTLGESFVVTGLGLIGLLTVQLLRAAGCRVLGIDFDAGRLELARRFGAQTCDLSQGEDPLAAAAAFSRGRGVDGVLITAATDSNQPVHQAAQMCRKRGRIILVGVAGLTLSRADFYEKELTFQVSCSYGPGRYDAAYEQAGHDYPPGFVRWTVQRNLEAVLDSLAAGSLDPTPLVSQRFPLAAAAGAYEQVAGGGSGGATLGMLLEYPAAAETRDEQRIRTAIDLPAGGAAAVGGRQPRIAMLGAGAFARRTLIPSFRRAGAGLQLVASQSGLSASLAARQFGFSRATSDAELVWGEAEVDAVVIATRHDSHAEYTCRALAAGKHVYVEKPLALTHAQIDRIVAACGAGPSAGPGPRPAPILMVGFNRRFAPLVQRLAAWLSRRDEPKSLVMTVNAGPLPADSWLHDRAAGGGRIVGEACHFIDLLRFLSGQRIVSLQAAAAGGGAAQAAAGAQTATITLQFADGSLGTVHYLADGHRGFPKERLEVFSGGGVLQLDNFRRLRGYGWPRAARRGGWRQDKGHAAAAAAFLAAVSGPLPPPIPIDQIIEVARVTLDVLPAARSGRVVRYQRPDCHLQPRGDAPPADAEHPHPRAA